jgi:DNA repair photolyase
VKVNAVELLRHELADKRYRPKPIAMGTNTDPYQPAERNHKLTRGILEVLLETKHPVTIVTKSALILRDLDILSRMAQRGLVEATVSVTTLDPDLARKLEPRAPTPPRRRAAIEALGAAGISTGVLAAPMIPALNDPELEAILAAATARGATRAGYVLLRLPLEIKDLFREWLEAHVPDRAEHVLSLVRDTREGNLYQAKFGTRMRGTGPYAELLRQRYRVAMRKLGLAKRGGGAIGLRSDLFAVPKGERPQFELF